MQSIDSISTTLSNFLEHPLMTGLQLDWTFLVLSLALLGTVTSRAQETNSPEPGQQVAREATVEVNDQKITIHYWLYLPPDSAAQKSLPLLIFLHGAGERGKNLELVQKWGPPQQVSEGQELPFLLISPQCPEGETWNVEALDKLIDRIIEEFPVDTERLYLTGLSMGGYGTWNLLAHRPDRFAAAVPICGGGDPATAEKLKEIPIWAFHGDQDTAVPLEKSQEMVTSIQNAGGKLVILTVYPGVGHNSWSPTYDNPEVYQWLLRHRRGTE